MKMKKMETLILLKRLCPLIVFFTLCGTTCAANEWVKAGYWTPNTTTIENIDSTLFTHLICAFAELDSATNATISLPDASFSRFSSSVRTKNPSLKTLLSIGGGGGGSSISQNLASMAASPSTRKSFINSTITVARSNYFDGLDLSYISPSTPSDMSNLGILLSEWRTAVDAESTSTDRQRLILTASVHYTSTDYPPYPVKSIAANLDWINLMAYDFTAPITWGNLNKTGPTAALYDPTTHVSGSDGVNAWIHAGVSASKIVLSIPFYGYAWRLTDPNNHGYGAPAAGPAISQDGALKYRDVLDFATGNVGAVKVFDSVKKGNYCYKGDTWISYDDVEAVAAKVEYVTGNGLLGYAAWQIGGDDDAFTLSSTAATSLTTRILPVFLGALCYE